MQIEKYTDRLKALVQSAQSLALRSGHQQFTPLLGVKKNASQDESQKAYRPLAKKLHPDLNPGNKQAEERFKEISAAYDLLGDPDKRARFDRGVNDEGIPVVLDLVDQIYGLRRMLRGLLSTMKAQQQERERA